MMNITRPGSFLDMSGKGCVHFSVFDKSRKLLSALDIPLTSPRMIHDFGMTENYVIIPDLPLEFSILNSIFKGHFVFNFDKNQKSRYGIMKKYNKDVQKIKWFDLPTHWAFHYVNAWEEKDEEGRDIIVFWGCTMDDVCLDFHQEHPFYGENRISLTKMTFNLYTGNSTFQKYENGSSFDFPIVPSDMVGRRTQFCYLSQ